MPFVELIVVYCIIQPQQRAENTSMYDASLSLPSQNLLDLAYLFLNFAGYLFGLAFGLQIGIVNDLPGYFLDFTLCFMKLAFCLVLRTRFHGISPLEF
jgi:hypothetical protein